MGGGDVGFFFWQWVTDDTEPSCDAVAYFVQD